MNRLALILTASVVAAGAVVVADAGRAAADPACTLYWTGAYAGHQYWTDARSWSTDVAGKNVSQRAPNASDFVCTSRHVYYSNAYIPPQAVTVGGANLTGTNVELGPGSTLTITTYDSTFSGLVAGAGNINPQLPVAITSSADITITGNATIGQAGETVTLDGSGALAIASGASLSLYADAVHLTGGRRLVNYGSISGRRCSISATALCTTSEPSTPAHGPPAASRDPRPPRS